MATQVIQQGGNVRLIVSGQQGRGIADAEVINGDLVLDYTDGTSDNVGQVVSSGILPNALVGRDSGDFLVSRVTGDILVGRN